MSHTFGEIRQIAFVVPNIDTAMEYWADTLGIGPFFVKRKLTLDNFQYRGVSSESPCISIALANSGFLQIELIQQHDEKPSMYQEFLNSGRRGIQHVSSWVTAQEFTEKKAELLNNGHRLLQEGTIPSSGVRLAYFDTELDENGIVFEMADLKEPSQYERVMGIAEAGKNWNRSQKVVEVGT